MARPRRPPPEKVKTTLESLLFVAQGPVEVADLARCLRIKPEEAEAALEELTGEYQDRGFRLQRNGTLVQVVSAPETARYVQEFLNLDHQQRLSTAALETLAIVAYKQPITRAGIEAVRGVNSDAAVSTLLARELIEEVGRAPAPGRAAMFGVTIRFLEHFGLERPEDLPSLDEGEAGTGEA